jgi:hypothetical protein
MKDRHPHRSAIRNCSLGLLAGDHVLHQSGDDGEDRASGTAADDLTHDGPEVEVAARRACDRRDRPPVYTSSSEAVPALGCMALTRLTHTSMGPRSGCGIKRDRFCTQACAECITGP